MGSWLERFDGVEIRRLMVHVNEGLIVGAGILEGLSLAEEPERVALLAASAALAAGALSTAGASYSELRTEREAVDAFLAEEARIRELSPQEELAELAAIYKDKGLTPELARQVAEQLPLGEALADHAVEELGVSPDGVEQRPVLAATLAGAAFSLGSLVPIAAVLVTPDAWTPWVLVLAVLGGITATSVIAARSSQMNTWRTVRRGVLLGAAALLVAGLIGRIGHG